MAELTIEEQTQELKKLATVLQTLGFNTELKHEVIKLDTSEIDNTHLEVVHKGLFWSVWKDDESMFEVHLNNEDSYYEIYAYNIPDIVENFYQDIILNRQVSK